MLPTIPRASIVGVNLTLLVSAIIAAATAVAGLWVVPPHPFEGPAVLLVSAASFMFSVVFVGGWLVRRSPLSAYNRQFIYFGLHVYALSPILDSNLFPPAIRALVLKQFGANLHPQCVINGTVFDPNLLSVGEGTILGAQSLVYGHILEGGELDLAPVRVGRHVTVGARAILMPGVTIGDHAIVAAGSVVTKHSHIPAGEVWAGVPARPLHCKAKKAA